MAKKKKSSTWLSPTKQREAEIKRKELRKKRNIKLMAILLAIAVVVGVIVFCVKLATRPYYADIEIKYTIDGKEHTGIVTIWLRNDYAPITAKNFVKLAKQGYYNGKTFGKIVAGSYMMGGSAVSEEEKASLSPIFGEFANNGRADNSILHERGIVSMVLDDSTNNNSATSTFMILRKDITSLDGKQAAFGVVIGGMDIVDAICDNAKATDNQGTIPAEAQPTIVSVSIRRSK